MIESFNFLMVGRSGSGKSATTRLLTGQQNIDSKISPNSVTRSISFYESTTQRIQETKINFCVLDIPGLDQLSNRKTIRQTIFTEFKKRKLEIHGIIYAVDCVARDTVDNKKIFRFLNELPWAMRDIKDHVIPILTKYDNLVFDAEDQNTQKTLNEFAQIFYENGYGESWKSNALYWVNDTKNIIKKMNICQSIREVYQNQVENLVKTVRRIKSVLTYDKIEKFLEEEKRYVDKRIKQLIKSKLIPLQSLNYTICHNLKIELSNKLNTKSFAAFTAGSFGLILSRIVKNDLLKGVLALTSMISSGLIITNYMNQHEQVLAKKEKQLHQLDLLYPQNYLIMKLNELILHKFQSFQNKLEFKIEGNTLRIRVPQDFDGEYFLIESVECYFQDAKMVRQPEVGVFSHKLEDVHSKILEADVRMVLELRVPDQNSLLQRFEEQSSNFKQIYDKN